MTASATTVEKLSSTARVERLPDGRVAVRDVPFFSEIRLGDHATQGPAGRPPLDEAWLERCLAIHEARARDGHMPPLNLRHTFNNPKKVGTYRLRRIAKAKVNPQDEAPRATIFGDEIFDSEQAFEESKSYGSRSPEISPDWRDEFGPVALLREQSPFNKYPTLQFADAAIQQAALAFEAHGGLVLPCERRSVVAFESTINPKEGYMPAEAMAPPNGAPAKLSMEDRVAALEKKHAEHGAMLAKCYEAITKVAGLKPGDQNTDLEDGVKVQAHAATPDDDDKKKPKDGVGAGEPPAVSSARPGATFAAAPPSELPPISAVEFFAMKTTVERLTREKEATNLCAAAERDLASVGFAPAMVEQLRPEMFAAACSGGKAGLDAYLAPARRYHQFAATAPAPYAGLGQGGRATAGDPEDLAKALQTFGSRPELKEYIRQQYDLYNQPDGLRGIYAFEKICARDPRLNPNAAEGRGR